MRIYGEINDLVLFSLTFLYTIALLFTNTWTGCIFWGVLSILQLSLTGRIQWKYVIYFMLFLLLPSISLFITSYLHLKTGTTGQAKELFGYVFDNYRLEMSLYLTVRAGMLSLVSFTFLTAIRYDRLTYSLIQNLKFSVNLGYALLIAFNAVGNIRAEFLRIRQASRMRLKKKPIYFSYVIPLLVSATRYSQQAAMSLQTRGLCRDKSYIIDARLLKSDYIFLLINVTGIIICGWIFWR
jgi:energy-coupling factor transporter transmembrane protein EcfT